MEKELTDMVTLGARLKEVRLMLNMTQMDVAQDIHVKQISVTRMEAGKSVSAGMLLTFLDFYAQYISIDVLLDAKAWEAAIQDKEILLRKPHLSSVVNEKLKSMKDNMIRNIIEEKAKVNRELNNLENYLKRGMDSAIALTEE